MFTLILTNKAGHRPLTGLGYPFDATLGYPGEGPSHNPPTRRGVRPSLRLWSTRRSQTTSVDSLRIRLDFDGNSTKTTFGNSDTRLGQWLHASRHHYKTEATTGVVASNRGARRRHRQDSRPSVIIAPVALGADATEVLPAPLTASSSYTIGGVSASPAPSELSLPVTQAHPPRRDGSSFESLHSNKGLVWHL